MTSAGSGWVGVIANPASGKDIRRVAAHAFVVNNHEKVNIVQRLLLALVAAGVRRVEVMPDPFGIGLRALDGLCDRPDVLAATTLIDMPVEGGMVDSLHAARYLAAAGAGCIVVLGGDGTCRAVAKGLAQGPGDGCAPVPLVAISTGTNNVVPEFVEGTLAGLAAAYIAQHPALPREQIGYRHKRLAVYVNGQEVDLALVEVALVATSYVGARAVWQATEVRQILAARAEPASIGLSAAVGLVRPVARDASGGAAVRVVSNGQQLLVPLAPGSLLPMGIGAVLDLVPGVRYPVDGDRPAVLALDGEREIVLQEGDRAEVSLALDGPWIVDVARTLRLAAAEGAFAP
jgi:predicted polyphosphate/ATP-dependent NAD kinase